MTLPGYVSVYSHDEVRELPRRDGVASEQIVEELLGESRLLEERCDEALELFVNLDGEGDHSAETDNRGKPHTRDGTVELGDLLPDSELPEGFRYPREFMRVVGLGLTNLEPWLILKGEPLAERATSLQQRYPERTLVPFARRQDNDDVACWDVDAGGVSVIHDYASPGWEQRAQLANFHAWLRLPVEDLIEFE